ncbi:MAG: tRNA (N(6)-L-threonylcarbamoyladenosine(37)-C(2))-methylthiotransferase MtaB [Candidatus Neomarinimicrobiota bacterium]
MGTQAKTIAFHTLGCKLNFSETATISRNFIDQGFLKVDYSDIADIYVINTCSVTENADKEAKKLIRQAKRRNPNSFVAVIGCYAQLKPDEISKIDGVDIVAGAENKFNILEYLDKVDLRENAKILTSDIQKANIFRPSYSLGERTRSYLKIQDGCDYTCSFCTIPLARGKSRSDKIKRTVELAKEIASNGKKEIVLTGVNIGDYGRGSGESFLGLIKELDKINGIERIRISSIEPNLLSNEIIDFCSSSKLFMPHYHIPLQSGSNKILRLMRRRYDKELYQSRINHIRLVNPHACIGADVIVGFPGESEDDFLDTYKFINDLDISYLHVFTYSERVDTDAVSFKDSVEKNKRIERSKILRGLSDKKKRSFYKKYINTNRDVLFETMKNGILNGHTDNYIKVRVNSPVDFINTIHPTNLINIEGSGVQGQLLG